MSVSSLYLANDIRRYFDGVDCVQFRGYGKPKEEACDCCCNASSKFTVLMDLSVEEAAKEGFKQAEEHVCSDCKRNLEQLAIIEGKLDMPELPSIDETPWAYVSWQKSRLRDRRNEIKERSWKLVY